MKAVFSWPHFTLHCFLFSFSLSFWNGVAVGSVVSCEWLRETKICLCTNDAPVLCRFYCQMTSNLKSGSICLREAQTKGLAAVWGQLSYDLVATRFHVDFCSQRTGAEVSHSIVESLTFFNPVFAASLS